MKFRIGVMGSAQGPAMSKHSNEEKARALGRAIAEKRCILVNGSCPGLPDDAAEGAKKAGGFVLGISPAFSLKEHIKSYKSPIEHYDIILYTGMGLMERDIVNIRSSDAIVIIGGGIGTLNEFTVAFDEGKPLGILTETDGIADHIPEVVKLCHRKLNDRVIFDNNPRRLVARILDILRKDSGPILEDERIISNLTFEDDNTTSNVTITKSAKSTSHTDSL
ncbi:LOG family protein [Candidatus Peregrinibacteria bacterium]|nr:LOG family protein [Candidatus Peregrinibacteria bacterium]